jgi:hypothetical protein
MILLQPNRLWSQQEVLGNPSPVSREPGVYAWYFKEIPPGVPVGGCHTKDEHRFGQPISIAIRWNDSIKPKISA